jgi:hypothetical protein
VDSLLLSQADFVALSTQASPILMAWLGKPSETRARSLSEIGIHERSAAFTAASRLPTFDGADAFYSELVVFLDSGEAKVAPIPGRLVIRQTLEEGLKVCFAELAPGEQEAEFALRPVALPTGPLEIGGVRCHFCHVFGRRLADRNVDVEGKEPNAKLLVEVTNWYQATAEKRD